MVRRLRPAGRRRARGCLTRPARAPEAKDRPRDGPRPIITRAPNAWRLDRSPEVHDAYSAPVLWIPRDGASDNPGAAVAPLSNASGRASLSAYRREARMTTLHIQSGEEKFQIRPKLDDELDSAIEIHPMIA